ncbi:MAG TPA: 4Fe-4S binding protein [Candidatus Goldiibacteriota bacterium]|nr:4Fe-4S binding protein [Candidatus Goldiibacteriota bacterium]
MNVVIDAEKCTGCGACARMCPAGILYVDKGSKKAMVSDDKACDRLAGCMRICPQGAIKITRPAGIFASLFGA